MILAIPMAQCEQRKGYGGVEAHWIAQRFSVKAVLRDADADSPSPDQQRPIEGAQYRNAPQASLTSVTPSLNLG